MAVSLIGTGTWGHTNLSSLALTLPSGRVPNMQLIALTGAKDNTGTAVDTQSAPAGWSTGASAQTGTTLSTADAGSTRASCWNRVVDGTEGSTATWTMTDADPQVGQTWLFKTEGTGFSVVDTVLSDTTETLTSVSATGTTIAVTAGDMLCVHVITKSDAITHSSQTFTQTGCTFSAITWNLQTTTDGSDIAAYWTTFTCTAGTNSAAPVYAATSSVSGSSGCSVAVARVRQVGTTFVPQGYELTPPQIVQAAAIERQSCW